MIDKNKEVYKRALEIYGEKSQINMMFEEMSELQKELCKSTRGIQNRRMIADEIADVEIVLGQMKLLFDIENEVVERKEFKVERLMTRLDQKENETNKRVCKDGVCYMEVQE